ncbi:hypothetical protein CI109_106848 [Kwoniella shandongensis]|uniref:Uncharacterized protein n=1 Tax=Kwoniella shandongensis TaxID=1734106 RepID=A0A5M6C6G7_9TREE|nr:uncharacterized protein CI109_000896 [Kwoniella shandongensis]KAA5530716.1 hypothetical protein CI109_000896 [Kwoniella shandongensis]
METWPWDHLSRYCVNPNHRAWVESQLRQHPIPAGQSPEDWLLVRSLISEGKTEAEARAMAFGGQGQGQQSQSQGGAAFVSQGYPVVQQPQQQPRPPTTQRQSSNPSYNGGFPTANGSYSNGQPYGSSSSQQPPYGFVSLQEIAPQARKSPVYSSPHQIPSQSLPFYGASTTNGPNALAGPSSGISNHQHVNQPLTLSSSRPSPVITDAPSATPPPRSDSPFSLYPPGSASSTSSPIQAVPLSVHAAPGAKRPISPLPPSRNIKSATSSAQPNRKSKKNSSSIDPPSPPLGGSTAGLANGNDKGKSKMDSSAPTSTMTMPIIRPLLIPEALAAKPVRLFKYLRSKTSKGQDVPPDFIPDPSELQEIAEQLRDCASLEYLRAMGDDIRYCEVWEVWLRAFIKNPEKWDRAIAPVLHVLAKTDMPVDYIVELRLGKLAKKVSELARDRNLKNKYAIQSAFTKYNTYLVDVLLPGGRKSEEAIAEEAENKKRKIDEVVKEERKSNVDTTSKPGPSKVPAVTGPGATRPPIKSTTGVSNNAGSSKVPAKPSSTDMSFFGSAPASSSTSTKPRTNLPPIKKLDRPPSTTPTPAPSATSSLLSATLKALGSRGLTANVNATPEPSASNTLESKNQKEETKPPRYNAKGKLINSVRFRDLVKEEQGGGNLEDVKLFKEEPWEMEMPFWKIQTEEDVHGLSAHQLDQAEGAVLAAQRDHAVIDWYEPIPYVEDKPDYPPITPEVEAQNARERGILAVSYPPGIPIPDPSETDVRVIEPTAFGLRMMTPLNGMDKLRYHFPNHRQVQASSAYSAPLPPSVQGDQSTVSVSDLLNKLTGVLPTPSTTAYNYVPPTSHTPSYGQGGWGQSTTPAYGSGVSGGEQRPPWGGNDNYARNYGESHVPANRPQDRDRSRPICKFWPRGE